LIQKKISVNFKKLSILIPLYNEADTIHIVLDSIKNVEIASRVEKEIIVVDDHSTDNSREIVTNYIQENPHLNLKLFTHQKNKGKGGALHTAIKEATGEYCLIQDADTEYDPSEYNKLLKPILDGHADVVYGSRFIGGEPHRILFFWHSLGNKFLTFLSNMMTNLNLTDMESGYKIFNTEMLKSIQLAEKRFGFEPEVTAKISRIKGVRIYETGISYYGRTYEEGKKINWKDGFRAIYCIFKYNLISK
jgi:glycosyltransferase involved in cell wall biosynthesis